MLHGPFKVNDIFMSTKYILLIKENILCLFSLLTGIDPLKLAFLLIVLI